MVPLGGRNKGKGGSRFGRFLKGKGKAVTAILVVLVLLVTATAMSISELITMFEDADDEDEDQAGAFTTVTLYVQAMNTGNKPVENVTVDLQPTTKNKDGSEIQLPATGKDGIASTVIGTSGGDFGAPKDGEKILGSVSYYCDHGGTHCGPQTEQGVCATDPWVIPHGSVMYIREVDAKTLKPTGRVYGYAEATDIGGFSWPRKSNSGTGRNADGPAVNGQRYGMYDKYGGKTYKRIVDVWYPSKSAGAPWSTRLAEIVIVKNGGKTGCSVSSSYSGFSPTMSYKQCMKQGGSLAPLYNARSGGTVNSSGQASGFQNYSDYTVTCTGGLTCGKFGASGSLDVDSLVNGNTQTITIPGGKLKFWVDISTDQDGDLGAGATDYLDWMIKVSASPKVGYDCNGQGGGWGRYGHRRYNYNPGGCLDVDCSSFVFYALYNTGYLKGENPKAPFYTGTMGGILLKHGFKEVSMSQLKPGDILWRNGHTEVYVGGKQYSIGAHRDINGTHGKSGGNKATTEVGYAGGPPRRSPFKKAYRFMGTKK